MATDLALAPNMTCVRGMDAAWRCFGSNATGRTGNPASTVQLGPGLSLSHASQRAFVPDTVTGVAGVTCTSESGWIQCLGTNASESLLAPSAVSDTHLALPGRMVSRAASVAVGLSHACASTRNGRALCWGRNGLSTQQLAEATSFNADAPIVMPLAGVRQLAAAGDHTCARLEDGSVSCWGDADRGGRGDGTTADSTAPSVVSGLPDAVAIGLGMQHACAIRASGEVVCWGNNEAGALGDGSLSHADCGGVDCSPTPVTVSGLPAGVRPVQVGGGGITVGPTTIAPGFSCARLEDGTVWCWGSNALGALGDGTGMDSATAVQVAGLDDTTDLSVSYTHACALRANGDTMCWGADFGVAAGRPLPICRLGFSCATSPVRALTVGPSRRLATTGQGACTEGTDGAVRCWGETTTDGSTALFPGAPIAGVVNLTGLAGGFGLACGILTSGDVLCWGPGPRGALLGSPLEPTAVLGL